MKLDISRITILALFFAVGCKGSMTLNGEPGDPGDPGVDEQVEEVDETTLPDDVEVVPGQEFECRDDTDDPGPALIRRLTVDEYIETVRVVTGVDIEEQARDRLPADVRTDGFTNTSYNLAVGYEHVQSFAALAGQIVDGMDVAVFAEQWASCSELSEECLREVIDAVGLRVLRAPVEPEQMDAYLGVFEAVVAEDGTYEEAVSYVLEAMFQSPEFLYRVEDERGEGMSRPVDSWAMASRLSYLVWGGPPDEELLQAAADDDLTTVDGVSEQLGRMFDDARARGASKRFVRDWLGLNRLNNVSRDSERFPDWNAELAADMQAETLAYFESVAWEQDRPLVELYSAQETWASELLAAHYGLPDPQPGIVGYDVSSIPERGGLLTQGSLLTIGGDDASMVARGLFVLHDLLCGTIESAPPGVDTTPVPPEPGKSNRMIAETRLENGSCGGCHAQFEPFSFGLEPFDSTGVYAEMDEFGNELRQDGQLYLPGEPGSVSYESIGELNTVIAESTRARECMVLKMTQYALGRPLLQTDTCVLSEIDSQATADGGTYRATLEAIATSELMRMQRTEQ